MQLQLLKHIHPKQKNLSLWTLKPRERPDPVAPLLLLKCQSKQLNGKPISFTQNKWTVLA